MIVTKYVKSYNWPVECDLLMFSSYQMIDNVRSRCVAPSIAKPFSTNVAHYDARSLVNSAIFARVLWKIAMIVRLLFLFFELKFSKALSDARDL